MQYLSEGIVGKQLPEIHSVTGVSQVCVSCRIRRKHIIEHRGQKKIKFLLSVFENHPTELSAVGLLTAANLGVEVPACFHSGKIQHLIWGGIRTVFELYRIYIWAQRVHIQDSRMKQLSK